MLINLIEEGNYMTTTKEQLLKLNEQSGFVANRYKNENLMYHDSEKTNYNIPAQQYEKASIIYDSRNSYNKIYADGEEIGLEIKENTLTGL